MDNIIKIISSLEFSLQIEFMTLDEHYMISLTQKFAKYTSHQSIHSRKGENTPQNLPLAKPIFGVLGLLS